MATYIEDGEVSKLISEYAKREGKTKTGALRDLLHRELKILPKKLPEARFQDALAFVTSHPTETTPVKESDINLLYEYLDAH